MAETDRRAQGREPTAVDDVRRVRERISRESCGDLRKHVEETNRIFERLRSKLGMKVVPPPPRGTKRDGAAG